MSSTQVMALLLVKVRKVRTAEQKVLSANTLYEPLRMRIAQTVRATVTMRVATRETTKLLGVSKDTAILPAATDELHRNGFVPFLLKNGGGDKVQA